MLRSLLVFTVIAGLLTSCGFRRKKYENPITKDTKQPDKVLFDKAINDIEHGRFEVARITLEHDDQHLRSERVSGEGEAGDRR